MNSLAITVADGVATLSIQRPQTSNAIDISIIRAMHLALDQLQKGDSGARAVVITGSNDVFCSGLDLHSIDLKSQQARQRAHFEMRRFMDPLILRLSGFRFPIVAAVNGAAVDPDADNYGKDNHAAARKDASLRWRGLGGMIGKVGSLLGLDRRADE